MARVQIAADKLSFGQHLVKCHFVQRYKTPVGSRNIENTNLAHDSFHQLPSYLYWGILVVAFFYFSWMRGKNALATSEHGEDFWYNCMHCQKTISAELILLGARR